MSDVLKYPFGYQLSFIDFVPEKFPFEIDQCAEKKDDDAAENCCKKWCWECPNSIVGSEWSGEDDEKKRGIMDDEERS
jgi:hypothetical protein